MQTKIPYSNRQCPGFIITLNCVDFISDKKLKNQVMELVKAEYYDIRFNLKKFDENDIKRVERILSVCQLVEQENGIRFSVYFDLPYPQKKYRFLCKKSIDCEKGDILTVYPLKTGWDDGEKIFIEEGFFEKSYETGNKFYYGDGEGKLEILESTHEYMTLRGLNSFELIHEKSISSSSRVHIQLNEVQKEFIVKAYNTYNLCGLFLSFCETADEVNALKQEFSDEIWEKVGVFPKIETQIAVEQIDELVTAADGVMVARGDLALYSDIFMFNEIQEKIAIKAKEAGKKLYFATDFLNSLLERYFPSRADLVDYLTAVKNGADAIVIKAAFFVEKKVDHIKGFVDSI